jgi:hypothetical protein
MSTLVMKHKIFSMTDFKRNSEAIYNELVSSGMSGIIVQDSNPYLLIKPLKSRQYNPESLKKFQNKTKEKILQAASTRKSTNPIKITNQEIDSVEL